MHACCSQEDNHPPSEEEDQQKNPSNEDVEGHLLSVSVDGHYTARAKGLALRNTPLDNTATTGMELQPQPNLNPNLSHQKTAVSLISTAIPT